MSLHARSVRCKNEALEKLLLKSTIKCNGFSYARFRFEIRCIFCWHGSMGFPKETPLWKAFPDRSQKSSEIWKMTVFQEMGINSNLLNQIQWSWYHSLLWKMLYLMIYD